jgi:hypothetical protein
VSVKCPSVISETRLRKKSEKHENVVTGVDDMLQTHVPIHDDNSKTIPRMTINGPNVLEN